jgi:site-specific DNA recombinase
VLRVTEEEIMNLVTELGGIMQALKDADPADKAEMYRRIGLTLTYPAGKTSSSGSCRAVGAAV